MKIGIVVYSDDPESVWNAFRYGNFALREGEDVKVFLLGKGVECESLDTEKFPVTKELKSFAESGGKVLACGTCLKLRQAESPEHCPVSTMKDMYEMVKESDRVLTF